jgi:hypothetical protein
MKQRRTDSDMENKLVQLNARVPLPMKHAIKMSAKRSRIDLEAIVQDMVRVYAGMATPETETRRTLFLNAFKEVTRGRMPFNSPHIAGAALVPVG